MSVIDDNLALANENVPKVYEAGLGESTQYVKYTDVATSEKAGLVKVADTSGIELEEDGGICIKAASEAEIDAKTETCRPIVPATIDYAVRSVTTDENNSEVFNDYENNKIYGQYSHVENKAGIVGIENKIDNLIASHFENEANANITAYCSLTLYFNDKQFRKDVSSSEIAEDEVAAGDIIVANLSEKAKLYVIVSSNDSYQMDDKYYVIYKFEEFYLTDGFSFPDSLIVKTLALRYDSKKKGYDIIQTGIDNESHTIENAHGEGSSVVADSYQHGEGYNTRPYGKGSHAEGKDTVTFGDYSHSEGNGSAAFGFSAHAEGSETRAIGSWSHAEGKVSYAYAPYSHAEGSKTKAMKPSSHTEGDQTVANGNGAHAEGQGTQANGDQSHAEGNGSIAQGSHSHAEGCQTKALSSWVHAEGYKTEATKETAHAEGYESKATAVHSHAEGQRTVASGDHAHSEGIDTVASGIDSHAEGRGTIAKGMQQHVQGRYNVVDENNTYAHIIGNGTSSHRNNIHTVDWEGNAWFKSKVKIGGTSASDTDSFLATEKYANNLVKNEIPYYKGTDDHSFRASAACTASGARSFAEGDGTVASGMWSHAEGHNSKATASRAHAEGEGTEATAVSAHSEGEYTKATGDHSHAEGANTVASGYNAHAEGQSCLASGTNQHVQGKYNVEDAGSKYAHIVGNGTSVSDRSNAHTLDWAGNAWYQGSVECKGIILTSPNGTKYKITVDDNGNLTTTVQS